jgi:hypothetical protein
MIIGLAYTIILIEFWQRYFTLWRMHGRFLIAAIAAFVCSASFGDDASRALSVQFESAQAVVALRTANQPIQLPGLTFSLRVQAHCPAPETPASVSISIADSRITVAPDENGLIESEIHVSAKQLGPVLATDFCLDGDTDTTRPIELKGALSAQLSLRCKGENSESIRYATKLLNVALECMNPAIEPASDTGDISLP